MTLAAQTPPPSVSAPPATVLDALRAELPAAMESALAPVPVFAVAHGQGRNLVTTRGKDSNPEVVFFPDRAAAESWRAEHARTDPTGWADTRVAAYRLSDVASRHLARVAAYRSRFQGSATDVRAAEGLPAVVGSGPFACPVFVVRLSDGRYPTLVAKGADPFVPVHLAHADAEAMRRRTEAGLAAPTTARVETMELSTVLRLMMETRSGIATRFRPAASAANVKAANEAWNRPDAAPEPPPQH
ncbi:MAG: Tic22 family protein [Armatimonadota bacterium]